MNLIEPILFHARHNPDTVAICTPGTNPPLLTFGELAGWANNIARLPPVRGLKPGEPVGVHVADKILHLAILLGLARLGIASVSLPTASVPESLSVAAVIADRIADFADVGRVITIDQSWKAISAHGAIPLVETNPAHVSRIVLSSADAPEANAFKLTRAQLAHRVKRYDLVYGDAMATCRRLYCDFALHSAEGFEAILHMLWRGGTVFMFGADSAAMIQAFDLYQIEGMFASPEGLSRYLQFYEEPGAPECNFKFIACFGREFSPALSVRVQETMSSRLLHAYGLTEIGAVASAPADFLAHVPGAVGYVLPDTTVEIVDTADKPLLSGQKGSVRVKAAYGATDYVGTPAKAGHEFHEGWFYTGNVGSLRADQILIITPART